MNLHHRRSIRLPGYDYTSEGAYFVTVVTHHRERLFGEIVNDEMVLNDFGKIVREEWLKTAQLRSEVELIEDEFVIMPNHFHGIINITDSLGHGAPDDTVGAFNGRGDRPDDTVGAYGHTPLRNSFRSPSRSLGSMVRGFKSAVTTRINILRGTPGTPVWQRNYFEHIISTDREYETIAAYIANNPSNWNMDNERER